MMNKSKSMNGKRRLERRNRAGDDVILWLRNSCGCFVKCSPAPLCIFRRETETWDFKRTLPDIFIVCEPFKDVQWAVLVQLWGSTAQPCHASINTFYGLSFKGLIFLMRPAKWHWERVWTVGRSHRHRNAFKEIKIKPSPRQNRLTWMRKI